MHNNPQTEDDRTGGGVRVTFGTSFQARPTNVKSAEGLSAKPDKVGARESFGVTQYKVKLGQVLLNGSGLWRLCHSVIVAIKTVLTEFYWGDWEIIFFRFRFWLSLRNSFWWQNHCGCNNVCVVFSHCTFAKLLRGYIANNSCKIIIYCSLKKINTSRTRENQTEKNNHHIASWKVNAI